MAAAQHTQLSLRWVEGTDEIVAEWSGRRVVVARVVDPAWHENRAKAAEEAAANALVFAAAPAMLEVLRTVEWASEVDAEQGGHEIACPCCGNARRLGHGSYCSLAHAIAKAEGR